jgi:autotransporter-associated beta strand protein
MSISRVLPMLGFALVLGSSLPAQAQTNNFIGTNNASWSAGTNWSLGTVPTSSEDVFIANDTTVRISNTTTEVAGNLTIGGTNTPAGNNIFSAVALRSDTSNSLTVSGNITLAPGAGTGQLSLGTGSGFTSTLTIGGGSGSILDGEGAGFATIAIFGHMGTLGLATATADYLNINQNSSGSLTIGSGQTYTIGTTRVGSGTTNVTDALTVNGTLVSTTINPGASVANGNNSATFTLNTGGLVQATTLRRTGSQNITFDWNGGTIQNRSGGNLTVDATSGTLTIGLAGTGTHTFEADSGRTITVAATAQLQDKSGEAGTLNKAGGGTLLLQGANTYSGATTISGGTLMLSTNGAIASSSLLSVASGATLNVAAVAGGFKIGANQTLLGSGTVIGNTTIEGSLKPGNSPGLLTFNNDLTLAGASSTVMEFLGAGVRGTRYDAVNVGGLLTYDGSLTLDFGATLAQGAYNFNLFDFTSQSGFYDNISLIGAYSGSFTQNGTNWELSSGNETWNFSQSTGELSLNVIPEPSSLSLLLLGTVAWLRQRRRA